MGGNQPHLRPWGTITLLVTLSEITEKLERELQKPRKPKIMIVADNDLDGVTSAVRFDNALYSLGFETTLAFRDPIDFDLPLVEIKKTHPSVLILLDIAVDSVTNLRPAAHLANQVFLVDHHTIEENEIPPKIITYNPCFRGDCYTPTVSLVGELISQLASASVDNRENDFLILLLGLYSDAAISYHKMTNLEYSWHFEPQFEEVFNQAIAGFPDYFKIITSLHKIQYPYFQKIVKSFDSYIEDVGFDEVSTQLVNTSIEPKGISLFFSKVVQRYGQDFDDLLNQISSIMDTHLKDGNLILYRNETDYSNGILSRLLTEHSGKASVVYSTGKEITISARLPRDSTISLVPVFNQYGGGGHPRACGAKILPDQLRNFLADFQKIMVS